MKNLFLSIILLLMVFSCKLNKLDLSNNRKFCLLLENIDMKDQLYRGQIIDPFFKVLDSVYASKGIELSSNNPKKNASRLARKEMLKIGKIARNVVNSRPISDSLKKCNDSLMILQIKLDNENTELLLDIVKKRGYPNKDNCECNIFPKTVFRHSQPQYFEEIRPLILKEFKAGRLTKFRYNFILHHLNGRKKSEEHLIKG